MINFYHLFIIFNAYIIACDIESPSGHGKQPAKKRHYKKIVKSSSSKKRSRSHKVQKGKISKNSMLEQLNSNNIYLYDRKEAEIKKILF